MERATNPPLVVSFLLRGETASECESEAVAFALFLFIQRGQATEEKRQLRYRTPKRRDAAGMGKNKGKPCPNKKCG